MRLLCSCSLSQPVVLSSYLSCRVCRLSCRLMGLTQFYREGFGHSFVVLGYLHCLTGRASVHDGIMRVLVVAVTMWQMTKVDLKLTQVQGPLAIHPSSNADRCTSGWTGVARVEQRSLYQQPCSNSSRASKAILIEVRWRRFACKGWSKSAPSSRQ